MLLLLAPAIYSQKYTGSPVTRDRLVKAVKSKQFAVPIIVKLIRESGVDFEMTAAVESELRTANAHQSIIDAAKENYRYARTPVPRGGRPQVQDQAGSRYEQLFYEALEALNRLGASPNQTEINFATGQAIERANLAVKAAPSRPEAYSVLCRAYLIRRNFPEAERNAQSAITRGGTAVFPVLHLAGNPHLEFLHIGSGFLTVESDQKFFQYARNQISAPSRQQDYRLGNVFVAVFGFATVDQSGQYVWYFSPGQTGSLDEAAVIMRLIQRHSRGAN
jgi:hypothetical protein